MPFKGGKVNILLHKFKYAQAPSLRTHSPVLLCGVRELDQLLIYVKYGFNNKKWNIRACGE